MEADCAAAVDGVVERADEDSLDVEWLPRLPLVSGACTFVRDAFGALDLEC